MRTLLAFSIFVVTVAAAPPKAAPQRESAVSIPLWADPADSVIMAADLSAFVNNKPATVARMLKPDSDLMILLVLDLTGDLALVQPAKQSLLAELASLPQNVWVALLHAQEGLTVLTDPSADREAISQAIESLPITGKAGLLDTLEPSAALADDVLRKSVVRVAILYVTDSDVTNYREDLTNPVINASDPHDLSRRFADGLVRERAARLERQLASTRAPLFILHLQYRPAGLNESYQSALASLAESTAGFATFCRSSGAIPEEIAKMFRYIRSSYFLKVGLPQPALPSIQLRFEWKNLDKAEPHLAYRSRILMKQR